MTDEVPEKLFVQLYTNTILATTLDPREVHDNGKPVYRFVRSDFALERAVEIVEAKRDEWTREARETESMDRVRYWSARVDAANEIISALNAAKEG